MRLDARRTLPSEVCRDNWLVRPEDFFIEPEPDPLDDFALTSPKFNRSLVRQLRSGRIEGSDDVEAAVALARLVHDDLEAFGTGGGEQLSEVDMRESLVALRSVLTRLGLEQFGVPFRDYRTFKSYWLKNDGYGSWQARRDILNDIFEPMHDALAERESAVLASSLADPISPRGRTGWSRVDGEIAELKRHFAQASTPQDYRNIGNDCVIVLEALSREVYDPARHLRDGEEEPSVAKTKQRIDRFIEDAAPGTDNAALRRLAKAATDHAQGVKHRADGSRKEAGIAADSVILLANLLRRLDEG
jgi:hypothetical protein